MGLTGEASLPPPPRPLNTSRIRPGCNKAPQPEDPLGSLHTGSGSLAQEADGPVLRPPRSVLTNKVSAWMSQLSVRGRLIPVSGWDYDPRTIRTELSSSLQVRANEVPAL